MPSGAAETGLATALARAATRFDPQEIAACLWSTLEAIVSGRVRAGRPPAEIVQDLIRFLVYMADHNELVGRSPMIYCLPKNAIRREERGGIEIGIGSPQLDRASVANVGRT